MHLMEGGAFLISMSVIVASGWVFLAAARDTRPPLTVLQCMDNETREHVRALLLSGLEKALQEHMAMTFRLWLRDQSDQPMRGISGMQLGISAYIRSREAAKRWDPPRCPEPTSRLPKQ